MSQPGTISLERPTPKIATITFSNPPVNLLTGETVTRLHELVAELGGDPGIQVVVFKSGVPDRPAFTAARLQHRSPLPLDPHRPAGARRDQVLPPLERPDPGKTPHQERAIRSSQPSIAPVDLIECQPGDHPRRPIQASSDSIARSRRPMAAAGRGRRQRCCLASSPTFCFLFGRAQAVSLTFRVRER